MNRQPENRLQTNTADGFAVASENSSRYLGNPVVVTQLLRDFCDNLHRKRVIPPKNSTSISRGFTLIIQGSVTNAFLAGKLGRR